MIAAGTPFAEATPRVVTVQAGQLRQFVTHVSICEWWEAFQLGQALLDSEVGDLVALVQIELAFRVGELDAVVSLRHRCGTLLPGNRMVAELLQRADDIQRRRAQFSLPESVIGVGSAALRTAAQIAIDCYHWRLGCDLLEHLAETDGGDAWAFARLARTWGALGEHVRAISALRRLAELDPAQADHDQETRLHKFEARRKQSYSAHVTRFEKHPGLLQVLSGLEDPGFAASPVGLALTAQCRRLEELAEVGLLEDAAATLAAPLASVAVPEAALPDVQPRPSAGQDPGPVGFRPPTAVQKLRIPNAFLHAKRRSDLVAGDQVDEPDRLSIRTVEGAGWVRVMFGLFDGLPLLCDW